MPAGSVALVGARGFTGPSLLSPLSGGIAQLRLWSVPLTLQEFASSGNAQSLQKLGLLVSFPCTLAAVDLETSVVQSVPARGSMSLYGAVNVSESSPPVL